MLQHSMVDAVSLPVTRRLTAEQLDKMANGAADHCNVQHLLESSLVDLALSVSRDGFSVSRDDIDQIQHARSVLQGEMSKAFARILFISEQRRSNLLAFQDWGFVSLGEDCFSRTVLNQWGLKPFAELGEKTTPFDLAIHPLPSVVELLETNFEGYLDLKNLSFDAANNVCRNLAPVIVFNHEPGPLYAENEFSRLREIYSRRISNFRALFQSSRKLVFVLRVRRPLPSDRDQLMRIHEALCQFAGDRPIRLIVINMRTPAEMASTRSDGRNLPYSLIDAAYPYEGYIWHDPKHCFTQAGHDFEFDVVQKIKSELH